MKKVFPLLLLCCMTLTSWSQATQNFWADVDASSIVLPSNARNQVSASHFRALTLDQGAMFSFLRTAPKEFTSTGSSKIITLPLPNGEMASFEMFDSPIMEDELAVQYPSMKTFKGKGLTEGYYSVRMGFTKKGFHATIHSKQGSIYIDPYASNQDRYYMAYLKKDFINHREDGGFQCGAEPGEIHLPDDVSSDELFHNQNARTPDNGQVQLRIYRLALACTGEYAQFHGGTEEDALSAMVIKVNRLNEVFERDLAIRMILIGITTNVIFLDPDTDPYTNGNTGAMLEENQDAMDYYITAPNFDFGHVIGTIGSFAGLASLGVSCGSGKAGGASTINTPIGDPFVIDIIAHEMGHQFGANHSFNSCHNVNSGTGYEPGGGTTIMSYAGICGDPVNNLQNFTSDYYHAISLHEIFLHTRIGGGDDCPEKILTNNTEPVIDIPHGNGFYIPISTPFELDANVEDAEGDQLTYCWEQYDLHLEIAPPGMPEGNSPLFRSFQPVEESNRVFPKIGTIINDSYERSEVLPTYSRNLTFRCVVRDNNPEAGGTVWEQINFKSTDTAGPFLVMHPNVDSVKWEAGANVEVNWDVANTTNELVNCQFVTIKLSIDGGYTYPYTLLESTRNDGIESVSVPNIETNEARIRVEAANSVFFDISNEDFEIIPASQAGYTLNLSSAGTQQLCSPDIVEIDINTSSILGFEEAINFDLIGTLPEGTSISFSQNPVLPNESSSLLIDFSTFSADTFHLQLRGISTGQDTLYRDISIITVSNDFTDLALVNPPNGQSQVGLSTFFEWLPSLDADHYDIEIATSPSFAPNTILETAILLTEANYTPSALLDINTLYYWRVIPFNECGAEIVVEPFSFHTQNVNCIPSDASDTPINISGNGTPTIESKLFVPVEGIISDLNIPLIKANYQPVNSLRVTLISPAGTEVILFDQNCGNTLNFYSGFDDEAPSDIICPPDDNIVYRPVESLSAFIGENTLGEWILRVKVVESGFGAAGSLSDWSLEFCASFEPNSPSLITNDTLFVPPGLSNTITQTLLEVQDADNDPSELEYTIVTAPSNGTLYLQGQPLTSGGTFRQTTINSGNLWYTHNGSDTQLDHFTFTVNDGGGGWIPSQKFNIKIDENAVVGTTELDTPNDISIYPNPTTGLINIAFSKEVEEDLMLRLINVQGQEVLRRNFRQVGNLLSLETSNLPGGIYFVSLQTRDAVYSKKVMIQR